MQLSCKQYLVCFSAVDTQHIHLLGHNRKSHQTVMCMSVNEVCLSNVQPVEDLWQRKLKNRFWNAKKGVQRGCIYSWWLTPRLVLWAFLITSFFITGSSQLPFLSAAKTSQEKIFIQIYVTMCVQKCGECWYSKVNANNPIWILWMSNNILNIHFLDKHQQMLTVNIHCAS